MLHTISPQDMREMELAFLEATQYPSILLMEHAAQAVVDVMASYADPTRGDLALFACGPGNNGGDGCAAARLWIQRGGTAEVWLLTSASKMKGDAGRNACLLNPYGAGMTILYGDAPQPSRDCKVIVDALFGTGLSRAPEGTALSAIRQINDSGLPVVAVDIPSGIDGETGHILGEAVHATQTVTFHRPKHGHFLFPGRALCGKLTIADIGILPDWDGAQGMDLLEASDASALLPARAPDAHKGTFGHVLTIAGSEGMAGAACLCTQAALRSGAGLVTAACCAANRIPLQVQVPCAMAQVVSSGSALDAASGMKLYDLAQGKTLVIGPGLGQMDGTWRAIAPLVSSDIPKVLDADALNLLARHGGKVGANTVLTPHLGEMARLCGVSTADIAASPVAFAQQLAQDKDCCVLLKGATTVIVLGEDVTLNTTGSQAMATGGSGDVLAGVIAGLLAQGMSPMDAARVGAYYHGLAGESAAQKLGDRAVTAQDILQFLHII